MVRHSFVAALLAALAHPRWWALALAGFLVRGGFIALLVPIVVPPTVAGVTATLSPTVVVLASGGAAFPFVAVILVALAIFGVIVLASALGAWFDAALASDAGADEDLGLASVPRGPGSGPLPPGLGTARFGPHVATAVVFAIAAVAIVEVAYREATSPGAPTTPFVIRVLAQTLGPVVALIVTWLVAEAAGGLALRALLWAGRPDVARVGPAVLAGVRSALRGGALVTLVLTDVVTLVVAIPGALAAARAWYQLRLFFTNGADAGILAIGTFIFVAVVLGWLALLALVLAWRSTVWTIQALSVTQPSAGASEASR